MTKRCGWVLAWLMLWSAVATATPSIEDYGKLPTIGGMSISPSGKLLVFRKTEDVKDYLVVYSLDDRTIVRAVDITEIDPHDFYFLNENHVILVVSDYTKIDGYRGFHNVGVAFRLDVKSGDVEQLLQPGRRIYTGQTWLGQIIGVSKDHKYAFMPAYVGADELESPPRAVMKVDLDKPYKLREVHKGRNSSTDFFVNRKGEVIAEERYDDKRNLHQVLALQGKKWNVVFEQETPIRTASFEGITGDGKFLVMLTEDESTGRDGYYLLSLADGSITPSNFSRSDKDIERLYKDNNRVVYGVRYSGFTPSYHFFDKKLNTLMANIIAKFPEQSVWLMGWTSSWEKVVVQVEGSQFVGDFFVADQAGDVKYITTSRPGISAEDIHPIAIFRYKAADGLEIPSLITIPRTQVENLKNLPAVIMPHGGPQSYNRISFDYLAQVFASRGYMVLQPQFRGSDGFGGDFVRAGHGEWGRKMQTDISDGVRLLVERGMIDPERVCIVGWSYGGYAALAGGAFSPELYKCVVAINGVSDLPKMMKSEKWEHGSDSWVVSYWEKAMARGDASKERLKEVSPAYFADAFQAPVLLIAGERDKVVPAAQSKTMLSRLKKAGKEAELIIAEDDSHGIIQGPNRIGAVTAMVNFVDKYLTPTEKK